MGCDGTEWESVRETDTHRPTRVNFAVGLLKERVIWVGGRNAQNQGHSGLQNPKLAVNSCKTEFSIL